MKYKAFVYLSVIIDGEKRVVGLETEEKDNKEDLLEFLTLLHEQKIIVAYRVLYSSNENWYNDSEIVYLPKECGPIIH